MEIGDVVGGRYELVGVIADGEASTVYEAEDSRLERRVAVKVLSEALAKLPTSVGLVEAARKASRLRGPSIVEVLDQGEPEGERPFVVMELVPGGSLRELLDARGSLGPKLALSVAAQLAEALAAAHDEGVAHLSISPDHVLVDLSDEEKPRALVKAFVFSRVVDVDAARPSFTGATGLGPELFYSAPERLVGEEGDERSDLYSLGAVLFEMLAGEPPFTKKSPLELMRQHLEEPVPRLSERGAAAPIPDEVEGLVGRLLEKDPGHRPGSAPEVAEAAREALEAIPESPEPPETSPPEGEALPTEKPPEDEAPRLPERAPPQADAGPGAPAEHPAKKQPWGLGLILCFVALSVLLVLLRWCETG